MTLRCDLVFMMWNGLPSSKWRNIWSAWKVFSFRNEKFKKITRNYTENQVQAAMAKAVGESSQGTWRWTPTKYTVAVLMWKSMENKSFSSCTNICTPMRVWESAFHVVIDRAAFLANFELLVGTVECCWDYRLLCVRNSILLKKKTKEKDRKKHLFLPLFSEGTHSLWELRNLEEDPKPYSSISQNTQLCSETDHWFPSCSSLSRSLPSALSSVVGGRLFVPSCSAQK